MQSRRDKFCINFIEYARQLVYCWLMGKIYSDVKFIQISLQQIIILCASLLMQFAICLRARAGMGGRSKGVNG